MSDLDSQVEWLVAFGMADGSQRALLANEVGSGSNDACPQLLALFPNQSRTIKVKQVENRTEKASDLDADSLPVYDPARPTPSFSGKRVKRGLYRAGGGRHINADVNGAYNIIRTVTPDACAQGRRGCVVHPMRLAL
jgi:hypothetical protein